ncbi:MAG: hypothetical protein KJ887_04660 [Candidatus Omnitrophica bacterium]|nr:hypothetical protein [Candidatus Omnitrophota bacterium]MBU1047606.1 hypothetical protein [Candidatus Omnitrophota bacterium]MBU1631486.1 hypothetical protein [Candidatus Omnitrophota bacterium]MBU1767240.1 hypothetical protein [Candidatus Omnitrophota bacterium]MBU1888968.1 hypothetical protein [Candidatus Omnitrophota bacterium]
MRKFITKVVALIVVVVLAFVAFHVIQSIIENRSLKKIIQRLTADSRIAEVMVVDVKSDPAKKKTYTTIKFVEYDTNMKALPPKYFTFSGNIIQFQSMVIRFDDFYVKKGDALKGKSAYVFLKAFTLKDNGAEVFEINKINEVPSGYEIEGITKIFEKDLWQKFWKYALEGEEAKRVGIKNAQIEAPGMKFIPGLLYTIYIEHDGGMRIDAKPLPDILKGEKVSF